MNLPNIITLAFAFFDPNFFVAYLISIAVFGLFQAIYMANAGITSLAKSFMLFSAIFIGMPP